MATATTEITPNNSTVLGYAAGWYWPYLRFEEAIVRQKASIAVAIAGPAAPDDLHLSVPFAHPDDGDEDTPSLAP